MLRYFHPWGEQQGHSAFAWSWLGAAMQATSLSFGTVNAPGQRYHPAVIAQAAATLAHMFPDRFWLAVGSGEALNEAITGQPWPLKSQSSASSTYSARECCPASAVGPEQVRRDEPAQDPTARLKRTLDVDARQGSLLHGDA